MTLCTSFYFGFVTLVAITHPFTARALECYICGTQDKSSVTMQWDPCWEKEPTAVRFSRPCAPEHLCNKVARYNGSQVVSVIRGCAPRIMRDGNYAHPKSYCGKQEYTTYGYQDEEDPDIQTMTCFCDTNYCNKSSAQAMPRLYMLIMTTALCSLLSGLHTWRNIHYSAITINPHNNNNI